MVHIIIYITLVAPYREQYLTMKNVIVLKEFRLTYSLNGQVHNRTEHVLFG